MVLRPSIEDARRYKREKGVRTLGIAKRLIDDGFYPPMAYDGPWMPQATISRCR